MKSVHQTLERVAREWVQEHWEPCPGKLKWRAPGKLLRASCWDGRLFLELACLIGCPRLPAQETEPRHHLLLLIPPSLALPHLFLFPGSVASGGRTGTWVMGERREKRRRGGIDLRLWRKECASSTLPCCSDPSGNSCFAGSRTDHDKMKHTQNWAYLEDRGLGHHIGGRIHVETGMF